MVINFQTVDIIKKVDKKEEYRKIPREFSHSYLM